MFEKERIKKLEKTISELRDENKELKKENALLQETIESNSKLVEAANSYREEHVKTLTIMKEAKEYYDTALLELLEEKKRFKNQFEDLISKIK